MEIIECIKTIKVGSSVIFEKGQLIDVDAPENLKVNSDVFSINFKNPEYFRKYKTSLEIGSYAIFNGNGRSYLCCITGFDTHFKRYKVSQVYGNYEDEAGERNLTPVETYYFVDTEGKTRFTYVGKNVDRDAWTKKTFNRFNTKDEAKAYINRINNEEF